MNCNTNVLAEILPELFKPQPNPPGRGNWSNYTQPKPPVGRGQELRNPKYAGRGVAFGRGEQHRLQPRGRGNP